jgi:hypothetical protein
VGLQARPCLRAAEPVLIFEKVNKNVYLKKNEERIEKCRRVGVVKMDTL